MWSNTGIFDDLDKTVDRAVTRVLTTYVKWYMLLRRNEHSENTLDELELCCLRSSADVVRIRELGLFCIWELVLCAYSVCLCISSLSSCSFLFHVVFLFSFALIVACTRACALSGFLSWGLNGSGCKRPIWFWFLSQNFQIHAKAYKCLVQAGLPNDLQAHVSNHFSSVPRSGCWKTLMPRQELPIARWK